MQDMRTTVTLDADVQALLRKVMKERGTSFKETLNSAIRAGLTKPNPKKRRFIQESLSLGAEQNFRWDKALEVAARLEDEELSRKLALGK